MEKEKKGQCQGDLVITELNKIQRTTLKTINELSALPEEEITEKTQLKLENAIRAHEFATKRLNFIYPYCRC